MKVTFKDNQLADLSERFTESKTAVPVIVQALLRDKLKQKRNELRPGIPSNTGRLRRAFNFWSRKQRSGVEAGLGFMRGKGVTANTAIAGNVLQHPGATPKKGTYLWIPLHRAAIGPTINPREFLDSGGFVKMSKAGNMIAFKRQGRGEPLVPYFILRTFIKFKEPPIGIEAAGIQAADETAAEIPTAIVAILEGKRKFLSGYNG